MCPYFAPYCGDGIAEGENRFWIPCGGPGFELSRFGELVRAKRDDGKQSQQSWRGTQDRLVGPLTLGFDAEMGADFLEGDFDLPAAHEPGGNGARPGGEDGRRGSLRLTNQARMAPARAARSVARKAWGSSSPLGARTSSQRIGTGGTPPRYQIAVPLVISTRRLVLSYHRLPRQRCQRTLRFLRMAESFFKRLPLTGGRPRPLCFCGGKANRLASRRSLVTTQTWLRTAARNSMAANALSATSTM